MSETCKEIQQLHKWAVVTLHPWLPSETEQLARARAWGVKESNLDDLDVSPIMIDDVRRVGRTTNWRRYLDARFSFIAGMKQIKPDGESVFFATPLCVGFSEKLARETIDGLWAAGMLVYVHSIGALYRAGDDISEFLAQVGREANAAHVRDCRKRKSE